MSEIDYCENNKDCSHTCCHQLILHTENIIFESTATEILEKSCHAVCSSWNNVQASIEKRCIESLNFMKFFFSKNYSFFNYSSFLVHVGGPLSNMSHVTSVTTHDTRHMVTCRDTRYLVTYHGRVWRSLLLKVMSGSFHFLMV